MRNLTHILNKKLRRVFAPLETRLRRRMHHPVENCNCTARSPDLWSSGNPLQRSIKEAAEFAIHSANLLIGWLPNGEKYLVGKIIMEVGPGQDFGMPLILMGFGAKAIVVDRYLCEWDPAYHEDFYRCLRTMAAERFSGIDASPFDSVIRHKGPVADGLTAMKIGLEEADALPRECVDISYSNATLEHLADVESAISQLARITRDGGIGFHQVDFRDHRDFSHPLEYLILNELELRKLLEKNSWACGNAWRYTEYQHLFERVGFDTHFEPNLFAEEDYLQDVLNRIDSRFRSTSIEAFRVLGGRFFITKSACNRQP